MPFIGHVNRLDSLADGTSRRPEDADGPPTSPTHRPRVLIEHPDRAWQWAAEHLLRDAGYAVSCCGGPQELPRHRCTLVERDRCSMVEEADVIVNALPLREPAHRAVLGALRTRRTAIPVIVEVPTAEVDELQDVLEGCRTIPFPVTPAQLLEAVEAAAKPPQP